MATKLTDTTTANATGVVTPAMGKFPEGGATFSVGLSSGTLGSAVVQLRAWNKSQETNGTPAKELLATFTLPVPSGSKVGDVFDSLPVFSIWDNWDWNVTTLSGGSSPVLRLSCVGVGV